MDVRIHDVVIFPIWERIAVGQVAQLYDGYCNVWDFDQNDMIYAVPLDSIIEIKSEYRVEDGSTTKPELKAS